MSTKFKVVIGMLIEASLPPVHSPIQGLRGFTHSHRHPERLGRACLEWIPRFEFSLREVPRPALTPCRLHSATSAGSTEGYEWADRDRCDMCN